MIFERAKKSFPPKDNFLPRKHRYARDLTDRWICFHIDIENIEYSHNEMQMYRNKSRFMRDAHGLFRRVRQIDSRATAAARVTIPHGRRERLFKSKVHSPIPSHLKRARAKGRSRILFWSGYSAVAAAAARAPVLWKGIVPLENFLGKLPYIVPRRYLRVSCGDGNNR